MIVVLDASTLINLANGETLGAILSLPGRRFLVSGAVRDESRSIATAIKEAVASGKLELVDDALITLRAFTEAKRALQLGDGETECILAAEQIGCSIACDDRAARDASIARLGQARLTGSIGLLRLARQEGLLTRAAAFASYELMRQRGGYLPNVAEQDF